MYKKEGMFSKLKNSTRTVCMKVLHTTLMEMRYYKLNLYHSCIKKFCNLQWLDFYLYLTLHNIYLNSNFYPTYPFVSVF